jgi:hypothetical protein
MQQLIFGFYTDYFPAQKVFIRWRCNDHPKTNCFCTTPTESKSQFLKQVTYIQLRWSLEQRGKTRRHILKFQALLILHKLSTGVCSEFDS